MGAGAAGLLFSRQFSYAEVLAGPVGAKLPVGKVGLELRVTAMNANTLRLSVTAIDEILDKINLEGYHLLTDEEKDILRRASSSDEF